MTIFYFTATGNSLAIAKRIGGKLISIPQVIDLNNTHYKDDVIGVIFPIYSLAPPKMVRQFLENTKLEANYTFAIGTYGNMSGACMHNVQKLAEKNGYHFNYANELFMLDNFLPVFEVGTEIKKLPKKKVEEMTEKIVQDINARKHRQAGASLGAKALSSAMNLMPVNEKGAQKYIINEKCNQCGTCTKVCPAKNIRVTSKVEFSDHCASCYACLHLCPQNAIHLKNEKSGKRWRNPEVSLSEIIKANRRISE